MPELSDVLTLLGRAAVADVIPPTPYPDKVERMATVVLQRLGFHVEAKIITVDKGSIFVVFPVVLDLLSIPGEPTTDAHAALTALFRECASPDSPAMAKLVDKFKATLISTKRGRPPITHELAGGEAGAVRGARAMSESEDLKPVLKQFSNVRCDPELHFVTAEVDGKRQQFSLSHRDAPEGDRRKLAAKFPATAPKGIDLPLHYRAKGDPYILVSDLATAISILEDDENGDGERDGGAR